MTGGGGGLKAHKATNLSVGGDINIIIGFNHIER